MLAALHPPWLGRHPETRTLDRTLLVVVGLMALQLVPLPTGVLTRLSPGVLDVASALDLDYSTGAGSGPLPAMPLSIDPRSTLWGGSVLTAAVLVFLVCRRLFQTSGLRTVVRSIVWLGLALALVGIAQEATANGLVYWWWEPFDEGAEPFGPFLNRNHFGTWATMATPLCMGYAFARLRVTDDEPGRRRVGPVFRLVFDERAMFAVMVGILLTVAVVISLSRSALVGLSAAFLTLLLGGGQRLDRRRRNWLIVYVIVTLIAVATLANLGSIISRIDQTLTGSSGLSRSLLIFASAGFRCDSMRPARWTPLPWLPDDRGPRRPS